MDDFHINDSSGTSLYVADMSHALRGTVPRLAQHRSTITVRPRTYDSGQPRDNYAVRNMEFRNSRDNDSRESDSTYPKGLDRGSGDSREMSASSGGATTQTGRQEHGAMNMEQMIQLLTLSLMKNLAQPQDTKNF